MPKDASPLIDRPVSDAVASIVSRNLDAARRALGRDDARGLHAFRVGLRRARTTLRAYRSWLPKVRRKDRRRLRRLARVTNAGRDAEVLLPLLTRLAGGLAPAERADVAPLRRRLRRSRHEAVAITSDLRDALRQAARPLRRRLRRMPGAPPAFGEALGRLLTADAAVLADELATLRTSDAVEAFHAARLTVKRVRYLLEPVRRIVPEASGLVRELQELQDRLGEIHDLDVLTQVVRTAIGTAHDAPAGLLSLDRLVALRRAELVERLRREWVERGATPTDTLAPLASRLVARGGAAPVALAGRR
jgi:CHAD domain-containing protein